MASLAVMQPYFFPYLGYFQLAHAAGRLVFYDDVNYIKGGWINRNRILLDRRPVYVTVPTQGASPWKKIHEVGVGYHQTNWERKLSARVRHAYAGAPYLAQALRLLEKVTGRRHDDIGEIAKASVAAVVDYLDLPVELVPTSRRYGNGDLKGEERVIDICRREGAERYINAPGGAALYDGERFRQAGVDLRFLAPALTPYPQGVGEFVPALSILDVLMYNGREQARRLVENYDVRSREAIA